jgi:hypothetical protein
MRWTNGGGVVGPAWHASFPLRNGKRFGLVLFDNFSRFFIGVFEGEAP